MKKTALSIKPLKIPFWAIAVLCLLLISVAFVWFGSHNSSQSKPTIIAGVSFNGDYKIGDGEWHPIVKGEHIPSTQGNVTFRGFFQMLDPFSEEPIGPVSEGSHVSLYFDHIACSIRFDSGGTLHFDPENEHLGEDACAIMTAGYTVGSDSEITLVFHNPHKFGNENAIDEFLEYMSLAPGIHYESTMLEKGSFNRNIGLVIVIASLIILGIALFSSIIHTKYSKEMWLIGIMSLCAGLYFMFSAFAVSIWNDSYITNTRMLGLCMMFYMLVCTSLVVIILKNRIKKLAAVVVSATGVTVLCCILLSFFDSIHFYDTWVYWAIVESIALVILSVCLIISFKGSTVTEKILYSTGILMSVAFFVDATATKFGLWDGGMISKQVFLAVFIMTLIIILRVIPSHINAAFKAKQLEAEQQALKLELQESRISIMLSQMQPHFIFNTLNTIYHLCEINPDVARSTISSFSEYLRNNIDNLGQSEMISFEKELSFVKTYLDIEKVRFDDELEIYYDIGASNFKLPVLTVQPIVENAVKHGTSKKDGATSLFISTRETDSCYEIYIRDTGVGFDTSNYKSDNHKHVGIINVRQRLENLCNGILEIESVVGSGTTATIRIPKKEDNKN